MKVKWKQIAKFEWIERAHFLYLYGFLVNFEPSLPFLYDYYADFGVYGDELTGDLIPLRIYANAVALIGVFLFVDISGYAFLNLLTPLCNLIACGLLLWRPNATNFRVAEVFYGLSLAFMVAYYSCIYAYSKVEDFQLRTALTRGAPLLGRVIASLIGHLFIVNEWLSPRDLLYFDFVALIGALLAWLLTPKVPESPDAKPAHTIKTKLDELRLNLTKSFTNKNVIKWSFWLATSICAYNQVQTFIHPLWQQKHANHSYHGLIDALFAFAALCATLLAAFANFDWKYKGDLILSITALIQGFFLIFTSQFDATWLLYLFYIGYGTFFYFVTTILFAEIAKLLPKGCYGIVFGSFNLFAMALNSILVVIINEEGTPNLTYKEQFLGYGLYHLAISVTFIIIGLAYWFAKTTYQ